MLFGVILGLHGANLSKTYATVTSVNGSSVTLSTPMPYSGMSAILLRNTPNGDFALAYLKTEGSRGSIIDSDPVGGKPLATLKSQPKVGDRVIGGFLYNRALIIAPSHGREEAIKRHFAVQTVKSQLFQSYLASAGVGANALSYKSFAKLLGIGVILIDKGKYVQIYDPISESVIAQEDF